MMLSLLLPPFLNSLLGGLSIAEVSLMIEECRGKAHLIGECFFEPCRIPPPLADSMHAERNSATALPYRH
jgi:hypothetical protein